MGSGFIPYAFSVHSFINSVGADVGFASIVGLAILVLLYFAQARETSSLRAQAAEAHQRIQQLEARIVHLSRSVNSPAPPPAAPAAPAVPVQPQAAALAMPVGERSPAPSGRPVAAPAGNGLTPPPVRVTGLTPLPAAPAMVGGPALSAATKLIKLPEPVLAPVAAPVPAVGAIPLGAAQPTERPLATVGGPPPVTAAANGGARAGLVDYPATADQPDDTFYGSLPTEPPPPRAQQARRQPTQPPRRPNGPPQRGSSGGGRSARRAIIAVTATLLVAAVAVIAIILTSSGGSGKATHTNAASTQAKGTKRGSRAVAFNPATVGVSVLNGTSTQGAASSIGAKLQSDGYKIVSKGNAADQTHTISTVFYARGAKNDGLQVAKSLKLRADMVEPIDSGTQSLACQSTTPCSPKVVVTIGTDLASTS